MARIPTAANVAQAPSLRDPGVSVPAVGQEAARGVQVAGQSLSALAERRQRVSEAVDRTLLESKARELAFQSFNDWQSSGSVAEEDSVSGFVRDIETEFNGMLESHKGGPESRARLQAQLESIRLDTIFKASTASTLARREILVTGVQRRVSETVGSVFQSAANLDDVLADYDNTLDEVSDALGDSVTFQLRQRGRETFVKSAMDGAIARGDLATVDSLLSDRSPYRQFISPEASTVYRAQLAKGRSTQARQSKFDEAKQFLTENGVEVTPEVAKALVGLSSSGAARSKEEQTVEFLRSKGVEVTEDDFRRIAGLSVADSKEDKTVEFLRSKGIEPTEDDFRRIAGLSDPRDPGLVAVQNGIAEYKRQFGTAPPADWVARLVDSAAGVPAVPGPAGPFEGTGLQQQMLNRVITGVDAYATGSMTAQDQMAFEASVVALASDRTNPVTGEVTRGSIPVPVLRALEAQGKRFDPERNVIMAKGGVPQPSSAASVPFFLDRARNPNLGPMNGAPAGAADPAPAPSPGASLSDSQLLDRVAAYGQGATDDISPIAQANLFDRADDIAGPVARIDAAIYSLPFVGPLLTGPETSDAQLWGTLMGRTLARARQQSPRFAVTEFEGLRKEISLSGSAWDNPERFRQGLVTIDGFLEAIEQKGEQFIASGTAPNEEKRRVATALDDIRFVREGLGVKQLPHPKDENEIALLPPGTVFIFNGQHYTRAAGSTN